MCVCVRNSLLCKVCIHFFNKKTLFFTISWAKHYTQKKWSDQCSNAWPSEYQELNVYVDGFLTEFSQRGFASLNSRAEKKSIWILVVSGTRKFTVHHYKSHTIAIVCFNTFSRLLVCVMNAMHLKSYIYRFGDGLWKRTTNEKKKICHRWCMNMWNTSQITMETVFNMLIPLNVWYGVRHHRCKEKF